MGRKMREIMVPLEGAAELPAQRSVKDALLALLKLRRGYRLLAVKERGRVVGLVGPREVIRAFVGEGQRVVNFRGWSVTLECGWLEGLLGRATLEERLDELARRPVREVMARPEEKLRADDDVGKAAQLLARSGQETLLVWQGNRPVGLVGPREILRALAEMVSPQEEGGTGKVVYLADYRGQGEVTTGTG